MTKLAALLRRLNAWPLMTWLLALGLILTLRFPAKFALQRDPLMLMDFEVYREVATRALQRDAARLYEPLSERMVFKYGPVWVLLLAPLGALPAHAAVVLWSLLNVLWLLLSCWFAQRLCRQHGLRPPGYLPLLAVLVMVRPVTSCFLLGQADLLWAALVGAFLYDRARGAGSGWRAAVWLALAASLKLPALIFVPYLFARRDVRGTARVLAVFLACNLAAAWWLAPAEPLGLWAAWGRALTANGTRFAFDIGNQSLLALAGRLLRSDGYGFNVLALPDASVTLLTFGAAGLLWLGSVWPTRRAAESPALPALMIVWMVLFSPSAWVATYAVFVLPLTVALALASAGPRPAASWIGLGGVVIASAFTHRKVWHALGIHYVRGESYAYLVLMILPLLGLALAWWLWSLRRGACPGRGRFSLPRSFPLRERNVP